MDDKAFEEFVKKSQCTEKAKEYSLEDAQFDRGILFAIYQINAMKEKPSELFEKTNERMRKNGYDIDALGYLMKKQKDGTWHVI